MPIIYRKIEFDEDGTLNEDINYVGIHPDVWHNLHPKITPEVGFYPVESAEYHIKGILEDMLAIINGKDMKFPLDQMRRRIIDILHELDGSRWVNESEQNYTEHPLTTSLKASDIWPPEAEVWQTDGLKEEEE